MSYLCIVIFDCDFESEIQTFKIGPVGLKGIYEFFYKEFKNALKAIIQMHHTRCNVVETRSSYMIRQWIYKLFAITFEVDNEHVCVINWSNFLPWQKVKKKQTANVMVV